MTDNKEIARLRGVMCRYFNHYPHYKDLTLDQLKMLEAIIRPEEK